jgi:WD40 repeat protein
MVREDFRDVPLSSDATAEDAMTSAEQDAHALRKLVDRLRKELAQERWRARSRELARLALSQLEVDPERALLLALEAINAAVTYESRDALQQAVSASHLRWAFGKSGDERIRHAYFAKDNRHVITAGEDGVLRWWDFDARKEIAALACCNGPIERFRLSPQHDRALVTATSTSTGQYRLVIVDLAERKTVASIDDDTPTGEGATIYVDDDDLRLLTAFFSHDGSRLVVGGGIDATDLSLWDCTSGVRLTKAADIGRCHGLDRDGRRAIVTRNDHSVVVLHLEGEGLATVLTLPSDIVTVSSFCDLHAGPMPFSADGTRVTLGTSDRVACVWDSRDGRLIHVLGCQTPCHGSTASFTPSGRYVTVRQNDSVTTEIWDAATGNKLCDLPHSDAFHVPMRFLTYSRQPDDAEYAIVGMGSNPQSWPLSANQVSEWDIRAGAIRSHFRLPGTHKFERCFTGDGTACHWRGRTEQDDISLDSNWGLRLNDGVVQLFARLESDEPDQPSAESGCGCTADRRIEYAAAGYTLLDSQTNQVLAKLGIVHRHLFTCNGLHLVIVAQGEANPEANFLQIWDGRSGRLRATIEDYGKNITALQFQPGEKRLLVGCGDHTIRLLSLETGTEMARAIVDTQDAPSYEAASSADGNKVAFTTSGRIHVWHVDRGAIVQAQTTLYAKDPRFSADGGWLLALDEDVARIWDTTTMQEIGCFAWHFGTVASGDLSPDKNLAATCGADGYVRMWEPLTGREITRWKTSVPIRFHQRLRFSEDGTYLCYDGRRLIVAVEQLVSLAKSRVCREFSEAERQLFLAEPETQAPSPA